MLGLAPYAVAYLAYRGSVTIAQEYGTALAVLVELNRFTLYERLRLDVPKSLKAERKLGDRLTNVLRLDNAGIVARIAEAKFKFNVVNTAQGQAMPSQLDPPSMTK